MFVFFFCYFFLWCKRLFFFCVVCLFSHLISSPNFTFRTHSPLPHNPSSTGRGRLPQTPKETLSQVSQSILSPCLLLLLHPLCHHHSSASLSCPSFVAPAAFFTTGSSWSDYGGRIHPNFACNATSGKTGFSSNVLKTSQAKLQICWTEQEDVCALSEDVCEEAGGQTHSEIREMVLLYYYYFILLLSSYFCQFPSPSLGCCSSSFFIRDCILQHISKQHLLFHIKFQRACLLSSLPFLTIILTSSVFGSYFFFTELIYDLWVLV